MSAERERLAVGGLVFALVVPATYMLERALEWVHGEAGDPRLVLRSLHTAYYWRVAVALWCGGLCAALVCSLLGRGSRDPSRLAARVRLLALGLVPLVVIVALRWP